MGWIVVMFIAVIIGAAATEKACPPEDQMIPLKNEEIVKQIKTCRDAGMTFDYKKNRFNQIVVIACQPEEKK